MSIRTPYRLERIAALRGVSVEQLIPQAIEQHGSVLSAAQDLGVAPNTLHNWLKTHNYQVDIKQIAVVTRMTPN